MRNAILRNHLKVLCETHERPRFHNQSPLLTILFTITKYGKTHTRFFKALGPEIEEQIKLAKDKIRFDL